VFSCVHLSVLMCECGNVRVFCKVDKCGNVRVFCKVDSECRIIWVFSYVDV